MERADVYDPRPLADSITFGEAVALGRRQPSIPNGAPVTPPPVGAPHSAACDPRRGQVTAGRRTSLLCGDHVLTVRSAVAATLPAHQPRLAARILAGEADHLPLMRAAYAAAERVLEGMFS